MRLSPDEGYNPDHRPGPVRLKARSRNSKQKGDKDSDDREEGMGPEDKSTDQEKYQGKSMFSEIKEPKRKAVRERGLSATSVNDNSRSPQKQKTRKTRFRPQGVHYLKKSTWFVNT